MTYETRNMGDDWEAVPGTSAQTGNTAPKFQWATSPEGRTAKVGILCIAYHLGYQNEQMGIQRQWPDSDALFALFTSAFPWFAAFYDETRAAQAATSGYTGPLHPLNANLVHNRLLYLFTVPGKKATFGGRIYAAMGPEHPLSPDQAAPGKLRETYLACSKIIRDRLVKRETITREEAVKWGAVRSEQGSLL